MIEELTSNTTYHLQLREPAMCLEEAKKVSDQTEYIMTEFEKMIGMGFAIMVAGLAGRFMLYLLFGK